MYKASSLVIHQPLLEPFLIMIMMVMKTKTQKAVHRIQMTDNSRRQRCHSFQPLLTTRLLITMTSGELTKGH